MPLLSMFLSSFTELFKFVKLNFFTAHPSKASPFAGAAKFYKKKTFERVKTNEIKSLLALNLMT